MPKINQEEYEILKGMNKDWKFLARDEDGRLYKYLTLPFKQSEMWSAERQTWLKMNERNFQFIQWEDEEPYEIAELIREYEFGKILLAMAEEETVLEIIPKSEEKEMKDLEWAIKEIEGLMTEESQSYPHDKMVEQEIVLGILKQLEVETLSQDWIDNHTDKFVGNEGHRFVSTNDLQNLLVPRQEEVDPDEARFNRKVNKIIKAIENPKRLKLRDVVEKMESLSEVNQKQWLDRLNEKFGEIEQEPKYYVIDKEDNILLIRGYEGIEKADNLKITNSGGGALKLTEKEIKDYDERYWAFAVKVEELEE